MSYNNLIDTHTHSINSFDGNHTVDEMCEGVIKNGGVGICITDHCDIDMSDYEPQAFDKAFNDVEKAKVKYADRLSVYNGLELGQGIYMKKRSLEVLNGHDYDFILGSIHNLENMEDFYFLDYKQYDVYELLQRYFEDLLKLAEWNVTDSLAHLTYPLRYIVAREHIAVDMSRFDDIINLIFEVIIQNNKALELNVSGLFMPINDTLPNINYIKRFHDMGGKYVTVGTDSHYNDKVCIGLNKGYDILKQCGFDYFTVFEKREPKLIQIV